MILDAALQDFKRLIMKINPKPSKWLK